LLLNKLIFAIREFFRDRGVDKASVLAYYSLFSVFSFIVLGYYLFSKLLIKTEGDLLPSFLFTRGFFEKYSATLFERAREVALQMGKISLIVAVFFFFLGYLLLKKLVQYINDMFEAEVQRGFFILRLKEFLVLIVVIGILFFTIFFDALITFVKSNFYEKTIFRDYINPEAVKLLDSFLLNVLLPFLLTVFFFFILFKIVPEIVVRKRSALKAALVSAFFWEIIKRVYTYYLIKFSLFGKITDSIIALIIFGFWMELAMAIILFGAKLTWTFEQTK